MKTEKVKLITAELRATAGHRPLMPTQTARLSLIAHDIVSDRNPDKRVELVGRAKAAIARGEFEFTIQ